MRDDLHRSVPPRTAWARVLRLACNRGAPDELRDVITQAVRRDTEWLKTPWGISFEATLSRGNADLFPQEQMRIELNSLMRTCPSQHARTSCEIALGQLARDGLPGLDFKSKVMDKAMRVQAADCLELVASRVASQFDLNQASQVRRRLTEVLSGCDLTKEPPKRASAAQTTIEEDLESPLETFL